jgi:hypothetical protein
MKKLLLSLTCLLFGALSFGQTTLFSDDFESGSGLWQLNGGSGTNTWVVNNAYLGFAGLIPDTPNQPGAITNSPQSTYMHITNTTVCGGLSVCNANFDTGSASNQPTEITTAIDASGYTGVTLSFWYLCAGQTNTSFGTLEYTIDGGLSWVATGTSYVNTGSWTQETLSLPIWSGAPSLKFRFRWQNGGGGLDPSFSVDEILLVGTPGSSTDITTGTTIFPAAWCEGNSITLQVDFTSTGTFNAGNIYAAELSDAAGSFAAPTVIGTLASTANAGMVIAIVPGSTPAGNGYRIRVVSDNPATVGTDNGLDIVINANPTVTQAPFNDVCYDAGVFTLTGGSPAGGVYSGIGIQGMGTTFDPTALGQGTTNLTYTYTDGNGCSSSDSDSITVNPLPIVSIAPYSDVCSTDPAFTLSGGTPSNGTFSGPGVAAGIFDPVIAGAGVHTITYTFTDANGCVGTANETITVDICGSVAEEQLISFELSPNPAQESFQIVSQSNIERVLLLDMSGRVIKEFDASSSYAIQDLPSGVYVVRVYAGVLLQDQRLIKQ